MKRNWAFKPKDGSHYSLLLLFNYLSSWGKSLEGGKDTQVKEKQWKMQISTDKLHSWVQLPSGRRVLEAPRYHFEASSLNTTIYSGVSPYHIHSTHILQCVLISVFFRSPNSNKSLKQINAGILLDEVMFVLETATHSAPAKKQIYRPDAFHWNCYICSLFHLPDFSFLHFQISHWSPLWYSQNLPWRSDSEDLVWLTQLNRKNNQHINMVKCIFSCCCFSFPYMLFWLPWLLRSKGRGLRSAIPSFLTLCLFTLVWLQGRIYC